MAHGDYVSIANMQPVSWCVCCGLWVLQQSSVSPIIRNNVKVAYVSSFDMGQKSKADSGRQHVMLLGHVGWGSFLLI